MKIKLNDIELDTDKLSSMDRAKLKEALEVKDTAWPNEYDNYWYLESDGGAYTRYPEAGVIDEWFKITGNMFKTKDEALKHRAWLEARAVIREDAEGFVKTDEVLGWHGYYTSCDGLYVSLDSETFHPEVIYFESKAKILESQEKHRKEWLIYCGVES